MMRLCNCSDISTECNFMDIRKTKNLQSCLEFARSHIITELADISRSDDGNDFFTTTKCMSQLENLRFIRNRTEWTAYHTHTTGNAFVLQDTCTSLLITSDCLDTTGLFTWTDIVRDSIIRAGGFAFATLDTFVLINIRFSIFHGNRTLWTGLHTWMSDTAAAHIADNIFVWRTGCACRWNDLHKRRLVIFLIDVAGCQTVGQMDSFVFRAKREAHCKTNPLAGNGTFSVNTFTVFGFFLYNIIRNSFNIMNQGFVSGFKSGFGYFDINLVADCSDRCVIISHMYISFYRIAVIQLTVLHGKTE